MKRKPVVGFSGSYKDDLSVTCYSGIRACIKNKGYWVVKSIFLNPLYCSNKTLPYAKPFGSPQDSRDVTSN